MAIRKIFIYGDPILNKISKYVEKFDEQLWELLEDLKDTLRVQNGVGIAAPQVGILKRVIIAKLDDKNIEMINPEIIQESGKQNSKEGCLSCPGSWITVVRPKNVTVKSFDRFGKEFIISENNLNATILCHEIDHLNGLLIKKI